MSDSRMPTRQELEYITISNCINTICALCSSSPNQVINLLTGYCFDEEESYSIKRMMVNRGKFVFEDEFLKGEGE